MAHNAHHPHRIAAGRTFSLLPAATFYAIPLPPRPTFSAHPDTPAASSRARFDVAAAERTRSAMQVVAGAADVQARGVGRFVGLLVRRERIHIVPHELRHVRLTAFQQRAAAGLSRISHES